MHYPIKRMMIKLLETVAEKSYSSMEVPEGIKIIENIGYMQDDLKAHQLDIIYPAQKQTKYPVIINIHGGAFCMNSKDKIYRDYAIKLASHQFAIVNINYTLATEEVFPAQIKDVIAAINFLSRRAHIYQLDMNNVFLSGDSAGAYLAAMVGCISTNTKLQKYHHWKVPIKIRGIASNCGMFDFDTFMQKDIQFPMKKGIVEILFGTKRYKTLESFAYSSVLKHINEDYPPTYIMDTGMYSFEMEARRFEEVLIENQIDYKLHIYDKKDKLPHAFNIMGKYAQGEEVMEELFNFFEKYLAS